MLKVSAFYLEKQTVLFLKKISNPLSISKQKSFVYWLNFPEGFGYHTTKGYWMNFFYEESVGERNCWICGAQVGTPLFSRSFLSNTISILITQTTQIFIIFSFSILMNDYKKVPKNIDLFNFSKYKLWEKPKLPSLSLTRWKILTMEKIKIGWVLCCIKV